MADSQPTAPNPSGESAIDILGDALDAHGWRAESFAGALCALSTADGPMSPALLAAITDALEDHVQALTAAMREAHELLAAARRA